MMKNPMAVIAAVVCLFVIVPVAAFAVEQSEAVRNAVEFCESRYAGTDSSARLQQIICIQDQNILILQARIKKGESGLATAVDELRKKLDATQAKLAKVELDAIAPPPSIPPREGGRDESPPSGRGEGRVAEGGGMHFVGVPHTVVQAPGQYAAATFDPGGPRLELKWLADGVAQHLWEAGDEAEVRIIVKKNGVPIPVAHADLMRPWEQFYADLNHDGRPDTVPYKGVDPHQVGTLYISHVTQSDKVEIVYLTPTGLRVLVPGLPPQVLWGSPKRVQLDRVGALGRLQMSARNGTVL